MADVDILGPSERRRIWGAQEKAALVAEIDAEGGKVRLVARRHRYYDIVAPAAYRPGLTVSQAFQRMRWMGCRARPASVVLRPKELNPRREPVRLIGPGA